MIPMMKGQEVLIFLLTMKRFRKKNQLEALMGLKLKTIRSPSLKCSAL